MKETRTVKGHQKWIRCLRLSPDGKMLAGASDDHTIKMWNVKTGGQVQSLKGHSGPVRGISLSPEGRYLASAAFDLTVQLWKGGEALDN